MTLLKSILAEVHKAEYSPLMWHRTVRSIARGDFAPTDASEVAHGLFDWFVEIPTGAVSDTDAALLALDPDSVTDEAARKRLLRKQRKAHKRAVARSKTHTSRVCPTLVEVCERTLAAQTPVRAAEVLAFVSATVKVLTPAQIDDLASRLDDAVGAFMPDSSVVELAGVLEPLVTAQVKDTVAPLVFVFCHTHRLDMTKRYVPAAELLPAVNRARRLPTSRFAEVLADPATDNAVLGRVVKSSYSTDELVKIVPRRRTAWHNRLLALADVPYPFKPTADYTEATRVVRRVLSWASSRPGLLPSETFDELVEAYRARTEFAVPAGALLTDHRMGECVVTTICDSKSLTANSNHMGNCTNSYAAAYKAGQRVLFSVVYAGTRHNTDIDITMSGDKITTRCRETKARYNHQSPKAVSDNAKLLAELVKEACVADPGWRNKH